jgi:DNA-binding transcriptional LysR family regulator
MSIDRLDWDTLRVFRVVAELSSMSAAAARLGESPPTIGRKIDDLESKLGTQLFLRSTRGVDLTPAGQQALRQVMVMAEAAETLTRETSHGGDVVKGSITLFTGDGLGPYWIAPRLQQFQDQNPKVQVRLMVREETPDMHAEEAAIAITFADPRDPELISHRLGVQHYAGFASKEYLDKHGRPESLFEFYRHRCILHPSS